jgi:hypothetical protein
VIEEFIQKELLSRLKKAAVLVVYDSDRRYRELCLALADGSRIVIDATESGIESREQAMLALTSLGNAQPPANDVLICVPTRKPVDDEQKQIDPFASYAEAGAVFPQDDRDEFFSLCLLAKPDSATELRRVFSDNPKPSFAVIDSVGGGMNWPQLRATLKVQSSREILFALLAPEVGQLQSLKSEHGWATEARDFLLAVIGLELKTRGKTWTALAEETWRFLLFSEFVFDLPGSLPQALASVPRAPLEARCLIDDTCELLRNHPRTRSDYIEKAEAVEADLNLPGICRGIDDLGLKDTFSFEERTFLRHAISGLLRDDLDAAREVLTRHTDSVWLGKGESQAQWALVKGALQLIEVCGVLEPQLVNNGRSLDSLLEFYTDSLREADRLQREFEQAVGDFPDTYGLLGEVVEETRSRYRRLSEKAQSTFIKHVEATGWPPPGRLANVDVYDRFVGDKLKDRGYKIAYFMVDALRFELGVALNKLLSEDRSVALHASHAQLPTVTSVGMASLLPGAKKHLALDFQGDALVVKIGDSAVANVNQRMDVFRKQLGDRFFEMSLGDFVRKRKKLPATADLLVLRSTEIDTHLESSPESALSLIPGTLKHIRAALHKLQKDYGFHEAVIAADHGFFLNAQAEHGDVCVKPPGNWLLSAHDRILLGAGEADDHSFVISTDRLGIRGTFPQAAGPRSMAPYRAGHLYFHGGLSLPEAVVPVLIVKFGSAPQEEKPQVRVELSYKGDAKKITTRLPVVEVALFKDNLFAKANEIEILLEAQDQKGNVVGEPRPGADVNPATGTITLMPGDQKQIVLRMEPDFHGKFTIQALDPSTLFTYRTLHLETDYAV